MITTTDSPAATKRGTPLARSWTDEWVARVEAREEELGRRICGARTIGQGPCPAAATHASGRCGHHGGFDLTGAPEGNRNAAVHFLYARRLMPCSNHCPNWSACPLGGGSADRGRELLKRPDVDRPTCPYEQAEYTACVTDAMRRTQNHHENAWGLHVAHQVALMTVLVGRAARALSMHSFTQNTESYQGEHLVLTERPSAGLIAFEKLARELRRWTILLERGYAWISCDPTTAAHHKHRQSADTEADPDSVATTVHYPNHLHRGAEGHRDKSKKDGQDLQDGQDLTNRDAGNSAYSINPWPVISPGDSSGPAAPSVVKSNEVFNRIQALVSSVAPPAPKRTTDPPGPNLHQVLMQGLGP